LAVSGRTLRRLATAKHDFWAATGFYEDDSGGRAVLKVYRTTRFAGAPLRWLGRWQCAREVAFYRHLAGLSGVPVLLDRVGETAYLRAFVAGHPLSQARAVPDAFWPRLDAVMREVHCRGVAYVDANKPENILVGDDGHPYLIDFQIAWRCGPRANHALGRWWLARLQREDLYHALKHKRRFARESMTETELACVRQRSFLIRTHRAINLPYRMLRRPLLRWLRRTGRVLSSGSN
jgi:RIO-like serine/threonine protein kinase